MSMVGVVVTDVDDIDAALVFMLVGCSKGVMLAGSIGLLIACLALLGDCVGEVLQIESEIKVTWSVGFGWFVEPFCHGRIGIGCCELGFEFESISIGCHHF